jgi:hypothetical protein
MMKTTAPERRNNINGRKRRRLSPDGDEEQSANNNLSLNTKRYSIIETLYEENKLNEDRLYYYVPDQRFDGEVKPVRIYNQHNTLPFNDFMDETYKWLIMSSSIETSGYFQCWVPSGPGILFRMVTDASHSKVRK